MTPTVERAFGELQEIPGVGPEMVQDLIDRCVRLPDPCASM